MKKIILLITLLLMVVGCSTTTSGFANLTPEEQYKKVVQVLEDAKGLDLSMTTNIVMKTSDIEETQSIKMNMQVVDSDDPTQVKGAISVVEDTTQTQQNIYINDGYMYMNVQDMKMKIQIIDDEMIEAYTNVAEIEEYDPNIIKDLTSKQEGSDTIITFTINNDEVEGILDDLDDLQEQLPGSTLTMPTITGSYTVDKEGNIKKSSSHVISKINFEGETLEMDVNVDITFNKIGNVEVVLPDDLDSYQEF